MLNAMPVTMPAASPLVRAKDESECNEARMRGLPFLVRAGHSTIEWHSVRSMNGVVERGFPKRCP